MKLIKHTYHKPRNQTAEHFMLKHIARIYLRQRGLRYIGTEIYVYGKDDEISNKKIIDCVGVDVQNEITYGIEAKVSVSDFKNGYSTRCNYNYIICPYNLIKKEQLPDYVGLIYVDLENFKFIINGKQKLEGIKLIKKAKYHLNRYYTYYNKPNYDKISEHITLLQDSISLSNLNELMYNNDYVPKYKIN